MEGLRSFCHWSDSLSRTPTICRSPQDPNNPTSLSRVRVIVRATRALHEHNTSQRPLNVTISLRSRASSSWSSSSSPDHSSSSSFTNRTAPYLIFGAWFDGDCCVEFGPRPVRLHHGQIDILLQSCTFLSDDRANICEGFASSRPQICHSQTLSVAGDPPFCALSQHQYRIHVYPLIPPLPLPLPLG